MDADQDVKPPMGFVQCRLPWIAAGGAFVLYLLLLPRWITFLGLGATARAVGWDWRPAVHAPLQFLVAYPCRWLPPNLQVFGLNLLAAVCAALTLALLARSVALLPQNRTRDQRQAEARPFLSIPTAWLPPLLSVLVCGLQMTFWEHAMVWTGEMLDLLLFAYVIRCLLEYRHDPRDSWLMRLALAYGLAMTNNFAMIAFFPAMVIALFWSNGTSLFNFRLCSRMALCGLAGLSLYLLLPIVQSASGTLEQSFWELLRLNLGAQKQAIFTFRRAVVLMLSLTSLVPILFMGIKWPATFGDVSAAGNFLTNVMTHVMHGVFLLACLYVAFDPGYSPRRLATPHPFLPFYYLGALSIGYFGGYFLLVFGAGRIKAWQRPSVPRKALNGSLVGLVWVLAAAVPAGLAYQNWPTLRANLGPGLSQYGALTANSLPPGQTVLLSDDALLLYAVRAAIGQTGSAPDRVMTVETGALPLGFYHRYLASRHPGRWPAPLRPLKPSETVGPSSLIQLVSQLVRSNSVCYLHPSFGYYFEYYYPKPERLVYELKPYSAASLGAPAASAEELEENRAFWRKMKEQDLQPLLHALQPVRGKRPESFNALLGAYYSRALDYFGVQLQQSGDLQGAAECFGFALELNPDSPSAFLNREYNTALRAGRPEALKRNEEMEKRLSRFAGRWDMLVGGNGPVDEPGLRNDWAQLLSRGGNPRQAAQQLQRVSSLTPTNIDARVGVANLCIQAGLPDLALGFVADLRAKEKKLHTVDKQALIQIEAWAYVARDELPSAEKVLGQAEATYPLEDMPYATLAEIYLRLGRITNALEVLDRELKAQPENTAALNNFARVRMLNRDYEAAVNALDHALGLEPKNLLLIMNRAICNLKLGKLDEAQRDYQTLESSMPRVPYSVHFGLFDVAYRKKSPKTALKYGELYLKNAPKGTTEYQDVLERTRKAKSGVL